MSYFRPAAVAIAIAGALLATSANAQNLVQNPGFETGDFSGWTLGNTSSFVYVADTNGTNDEYGTGSYVAAFGTIGSSTQLSQSLNTVAGTNYTISFTLRNNGAPPNAFNASFGGSTLLSLNDSPVFPKTAYSFTSTATSALTTLLFDFRQDPSYFFFDDVSVTANAVAAGPAPEPATWAMMIVGFGLAGAALRRKREETLALAA